MPPDGAEEGFNPCAIILAMRRFVRPRIDARIRSKGIVPETARALSYFWPLEAGLQIAE